MHNQQPRQRPPMTRSATLHAGHAAHVLDIRTAASFWSRFRGLMLSAAQAPSAGLLLLDCPSVHSAFMLHAIDVIYLDGDGTVLKCVPRLKPWRASMSNAGRGSDGRRYPRARHTLEMAAGSIERLAIREGDRLDHAHWKVADPTPSAPPSSAADRQRGATMVEFAVAGPIITLLGLALIQYGMLFFAKSQINHAGFMAARAGSTGNASLDAVRTAYAKALVPLYGGGQNAAELAAALAAANADVGANVRIELLNPTKESFDDWPSLQAALADTGKRSIPNSNQAFKDQSVGATSGQTIQDANLIKLRITHGYELKVPVVSNIYRVFLRWLDPKTDAFHSQVVNAGRIPMVTSITLQMQSDAIEGATISLPGAGNGGNPVDPSPPTEPGDPPAPHDPPPDCTTIDCSNENPPVDPGGNCTGLDCPVCTGGQPVASPAVP